MSEFREPYRRYAAMEPGLAALEADVREAAASDCDRAEFWARSAKPRIASLVGWGRRPRPLVWADGGGFAAAADPDPADVLGTEAAYRAVYFYLHDVLYGAD